MPCVPRQSGAARNSEDYEVGKPTS